MLSEAKHLLCGGFKTLRSAQGDKVLNLSEVSQTNKLRLCLAS